MANEKKEQEFQQNMSQYIDSIISLGIQHKSKSHVTPMCKM